MYIHVLVYNIHVYTCTCIYMYMYTCIYMYMYNVALKHNSNLYTSVFQVLSITLLEVSHI